MINIDQPMFNHYSAIMVKHYEPVPLWFQALDFIISPWVYPILSEMFKYVNQSGRRVLEIATMSAEGVSSDLVPLGRVMAVFRWPDWTLQMSSRLDALTSLDGWLIDVNRGWFVSDSEHEQLYYRQ